MSLEPEEGTEGVVRCDLLGEGIARGIFEAVPVLEAVLDDEATIGLGILDGCDLLGVLDVVVPTLIAPTL